MVTKTVKELKEIAREKGIKGYYKLNKEKLLEVLGIAHAITLEVKENKRIYKRCCHNTIKYFCVKCKGSQICEHNKRKIRCKERKGSSICKHNRVRYLCKECGGKGI